MGEGEARVVEELNRTKGELDGQIEKLRSRFSVILKS